MTTSISINIEENENNDKINTKNEKKITQIENSKITCGEEYAFDTDCFVAKQLDYQENYILGDLKKIADYYDISTRKLRKDELIQEIVIYESNPGNAEIYLKRLQCWYWLKELKQDPKLKQFILF